MEKGALLNLWFSEELQMYDNVVKVDLYISFHLEFHATCRLKEN